MNIKNNLVSLFLKLTSVSIVVSIITLLANFIVAKFAEKSVYADFTIYQSYYLILSNFLPLGITAAVVFFNDQCEEEKLFAIIRRYILFIIPIFSIVSYLIFVLLGLLSKDGFEPSIIFFVVWAAYTQSCINILISFYQISNRYDMFMKIAFLNVAALLCAYSLGVFLFKDVGHLFFIYGVITFLLLLLFYKITSSEYLHVNIDKSLDKSILIYAIPTAVNSSVISFLVAGDKVLIGSLIDNEIVIADYGYSSFVASLFLFIVNNVATTIGVFLSQLKRDAESESAFCKTFKNNQLKNFSFLVVAILFMPVIYLSQFVFDMTEINSYLIISTVILSSYCIHGLSKLYLGFLNTFKSSLYILISGVFSCVFVLCLYQYFFEIYGVLGISLSFLVGAIVYIVLLVAGSYQIVRRYE